MPVGFDGLFNISHFVLSEIFLSKILGVILKLSLSSHLAITGIPSASTTMSGYETQKGAGIITSSFLLIVAIRAL